MYVLARTAFLANRSDSHFTIKGRAGYQYVDTAYVASGLRHPAGTVETNRSSIVRIEVVSFAPWPKDAAALTALATLCRCIDGRPGIPQNRPNGHPLVAATGHGPGRHNREAVNGTTQGGHHGHSRFPGNKRLDPGLSSAEVAVIPHSVKPSA
jgi:N-acetylmuramoyl-L-alanine amidase